MSNNTPPSTSVSVPAPRPPQRRPGPPAGARIYYKVVAVIGRRFVSIFDGKTQYKMDQVTTPPGGCWVCPDLLAVVQHATTLPSRSAQLDAPRAILQVAGWNTGGVPPRMPAGHSQSRSKLLVSHVMPLAVLPYTAAGQPGMGEHHAFLSDGIAAVSSLVSSGRPVSAPPPRPPSMQISSGEANRTYGAGEAQTRRLQANTAALHEDVILARVRLERLRSVNDVRALNDSHSGQPQPQWMQRALARIGGPRAG